VGVWVGNSNGAEMNSITGAIGAAVIWNRVMQAFYDDNDFLNLIKKKNPDGSYQKLQMDFVQPDGIIKASACSNKGGITDLFLSENKPRSCVNYKDPKGNIQLHSAPSDDKPRPKQTPKPQTTPVPVKPTPIPGILPPIFPAP